MGALLILVLFIAYLVISIWVIAKVKPRWGKWVALLIAVLIPTADAVYGRMKLKALCATEGGMKIFRTVEGVEGFYNMGGSADDGLLVKHEYRFVEGDAKGDSHERKSKLLTGEIVWEANVRLKSRFAIKLVPGNLRDKYLKNETQIIDISTNEILARTTRFSYSGGWVERSIAGLYGQRANVADCRFGYSQEDREQFILSVLKPQIITIERK